MHDPTSSCGLPPSNLQPSLATGGVCPRKRHIVTGTFNSPNLYVLAYDILSSPNSRLEIVQELAALGPHQYLSLGISSPSPLEYKKTIYATTWATPSTLSSWHFDPSSSTLRFGNSVEITAAGSYVHNQPPPYYTASAPGFGSKPGVSRWLGSAGGPTGELHRLDPETGLIREKVKEIIFLPGGKEELKGADKTRKALRYGAHSFDCSNNVAFSNNGGAEVEGDGNVEGVEARAESRGEGEEEREQVAFVADLGANAIQAYSFPSLDHLYTVPSKEKGDGPRHSIPHPSLPLLFTVTEHTNFVDAYSIPSPSSHSSSSLQARVKHLARADLLTPTQAKQRKEYRGDTLRFSSNLQYIYATTRGKTSQTKGILLAFKLTTKLVDGKLKVELQEKARFETRTSGGKANAIELAPQTTVYQTAFGKQTTVGEGEGEERDLLVLTDDEQGFIDVISFNFHKEQFMVEATTNLPKLEEGESQGASHAIWID